MNQDLRKRKITFKKRIPIILTALVMGAILGYAYYYFVGCSNNSCSITSSPLNSILTGMLIGGIWTIK